MKKLLILIGFIVFPVSVMAGYSNTEWGMSPDQVITAENGKAKSITPLKYSGSLGKVQAENIEINGSTFTATYLFDDADKLVQANLIGNDKKSDNLAIKQFDYLHQLLIQKYGDPQFKSADKITWKTSDTTIELSKVIIRGVLAQTSVRYIPNSKAKNETSNL